MSVFSDKMARLAQTDPTARATMAAYSSIPKDYLSGYYGNPGQDLSPELLQYLNSGGRLDPGGGNGVLVPDTSGRGIGYTYYGPGNQSYDYDQAGKFLRQYSSHDNAPGEFAKFMAVVASLGAGAAAAGGASAAGGGAGAAGAGGATTGAVGGATGALTGTELGTLGATEGGLGAAGAAGMAGAAGGGGGAAGTTAGMAGVGSSVIPEGVAFTPATAAEMGSMGVGGAAAGGGGILSRIGGALGGTGGGAAGDFNWGSLVGPALSAGSGIYAAGQARDAADAQLQAAREAMALNEPFRQSGLKADNRLLELLGIGGNAGAPDYGSAARDFSAADFNADPGYAFRQSEGLKALERSAAARGGLLSGKAAKDTMAYSQGLASDEYGRAYDRYQTNRTAKLNPLLAISGRGQTAANTVGEYATQAGNAQAAGRVGSANALTNALTQGYSMYSSDRLMDKLMQPRGLSYGY